MSSRTLGIIAVTLMALVLVYVGWSLALIPSPNR